MIRIHFRVLHIIIEKIIIRNTQPTHDVLGTSAEGLLKILTSGTYRGSSGDSQGTNTKIDDFMKKLFFRSNSPYRKKNYSKNLNRDVHRMSAGPSCGTTLGQIDGTFQGHPWDVGHPCFLKFNLQAHQTYFDRPFITLQRIVVAKNSLNSTVVKKII